MSGHSGKIRITYGSNDIEVVDTTESWIIIDNNTFLALMISRCLGKVTNIMVCSLSSMLKVDDRSFIWQLRRICEITVKCPSPSGLLTLLCDNIGIRGYMKMYESWCSRLCQGSLRYTMMNGCGCPVKRGHRVLLVPNNMCQITVK